MIFVKPSPGSVSPIQSNSNGPKWDFGEAVSRLSWDDLRIIKTLSDCANRAATAKKLGINVSTVSRRVAQVEKTLGVALFDHRKTGYLLTAEGVELRALAERVELDIVSVTRRVSRAGQGPLGRLRITTSDSLLLYFLTPIIADFKALNEGITIEVLVGNQTLSLARDESDIAVRATKKPADTLVGRKLANIAWAPYGSVKQAAIADPFAEGQSWVSYSGGLSGLKATGYVECRVPPEFISYRTDSVAAASAAIAAGLGFGFLPCMLGDITTGLVRAGPVVQALQDELWLLTHQDIRKSWRVKAFMTFCAAAVADLKPLVEGQQAIPAS
ncbi:LysR family transcriptional regulator [Pseudomonas putida]|uniref:LysR family transcriptional regulator n=1 Tax=Pseudomonas putida TaxID=303 RepID=A0AA37VN80_PSEPU|nr:LysR family transcriptional regulator [Pseudomonas putida]GLO12455.1 LysR family transcriptional regulator [Pseudomonas putida]GLO35163.1 LysR family transcriptional regulator [Pseudomonas putida]HDS0966342.1 LysR family transcriptional regulator [Pseudomonas putida]HDS0992630.1 LysR family transcriptional regulator [Pseudomonas putida]